MTYRIGDLVAHPMHGAGVIDRIETRKIGGEVRDYYALKLPVGDMLVMVPVTTCAAIGVRPIVAAEEAERIICAIPDIEINITQNWNKRYRENMLRIKSGDLMEVAAVVKSLVSRDLDRGLSNGERKMLHNAKQILISELVLAQQSSYDDMEKRLNLAMV